MNCPNCNCQIDSSQMYCPNCGSKQNQQVYPGVQQPQQQYPGTQQYPGMQQTQQQYQGTQQYLGAPTVQSILENTESDNEELLINAYIGRNEDKLKSGFSFCCLFLGVFYPLYRKMWAFAGIWYCINYIVSTIFPNTGIIGRVINVFAAIIFKELYVKTVSKRVNKIKDNNPGKTQEELIGICARKGGPTILGPILGALVIFTAAFTIAFVETFYEAKDSLELMKENLKPAEKVIIGDISFESGPGLTQYNSNDHFYMSGYSDSENCCSITAESFSKETCSSIEECMIIKTSDKTTDSSKVSISEINGSNWTSKTTYEKDNKGRELHVDHYYIEINDKIYGIQFKIYGIGDNCTKSRNNFIKTIKVN